MGNTPHKFNNNGQVVSLYEQDGLSPDEIAEGLGFSIEAVKTTLLNGSSLYRRRQKNPTNYAPGEELEVITNEEFEQVKTAYKQLAISSEVDAVRERAGRFLINEKLGRNKGITGLEKSSAINITLINAHIEQAKKRAEEILDIEAIPIKEENKLLLK